MVSDMGTPNFYQTTGETTLTGAQSASVKNSIIARTKLSFIILLISVNITGTAPTTAQRLSTLISQINITGNGIDQRVKTTVADVGISALAKLYKMLHPGETYINVDPLVSASGTTYTGRYLVPANMVGSVIALLTMASGSLGFTAVTNQTLTFDMVGVANATDVLSFSYSESVLGNSGLVTGMANYLGLASPATGTDPVSVLSSAKGPDGSISAVVAATLESAIDSLTGESYLFILGSSTKKSEIEINVSSTTGLYRVAVT